MSKLQFRLQLKDLISGESIITEGGKVYVATAGASKKLTLTDKDGASLSNPLSLTRGFMDFFVPDTNSSVDLYIATPGGQFVVAKSVKASGPNEILVDTGQRHQVMVIPFDQDDLTAATETDTGFDEPTNAVFLPDGSGNGIRVVDIDATETIDVGTATADSGDPDGFVAAASLGTAGIVLDNGALLTTLTGHISGGKSIVVTTTAGSDTGAGFINLPYVLVG